MKRNCTGEDTVEGSCHAGSAWQGGEKPAQGFRGGCMYLSGTGVCVSSGRKIKRTSHPLITGDSIPKVIPAAREQTRLFI